MDRDTGKDDLRVSGSAGAGLPVAPDGFVYFLPSDQAALPAEGIDLRSTFRAVWEARWFILIVTLVATASGLAYALLAQRWYRADVVVVPIESDPTNRLASQFGGLASLVGVNVGASNDAEPLAVLQSRDFARSFVERHGLLPVLFSARWDEGQDRWRGSEDKWPDLRDGTKIFVERVRRVTQDRKTGLITVSVTWKDAALAAEWANAYVGDVNESLRSRAIARSKASIEYLRSQIAGTDLVALQQPASRLLELELQKLMLANNGSEYAFRVVDVATVPKKPASPRKKLIVVGAFVLGSMLASLIVILRRLIAGGLVAGPRR